MLFTTDCWEWLACKNQDGYGLFKIKDKTWSAHRLAYELMKYKIPDNMTIDHLCRNRGCVNPEHLEVVTNHENVLRGIGLAATNKRKTHCIYGHEFSGYNLFIRSNGNRDCRTCKNRREKINRLKRALKT